MSDNQVHIARKDGLLIVTLANPDSNRMNLAVFRGLGVLRTWDKVGATAADQTNLAMNRVVMASDDATTAIKSFVENGPSRAPRVFTGT